MKDNALQHKFVRALIDGLSICVRKQRKEQNYLHRFLNVVRNFPNTKSDGAFLTNGAAYIRTMLLGRAYVFRDKGRHFYSQKMVYNRGVIRKDRLIES